MKFNTLVLMDARSTSLTVTWPSVEGASRYILEFRTAEEEDFSKLSDKLTSTQARKKNLTPEQSYVFRAAGVVNDTVGPWITQKEDAFTTLSKVQEEEECMAQPTTTNVGSDHALLISWQKFDKAVSGHELQIRENKGGCAWATIAPSLAGLICKKKKLNSSLGFQFRVRPSGSDAPFSPPSDSAIARNLSTGIQRLFHSLDNGTLLKSPGNPVPLIEALGDKEFVLLYVSATWCPPCRQFTPMLANWYRTAAVRSQLEIVFVSADHDVNGFKKYFATHPWMAVDYDDDARENLMGALQVKGIPRLVVLSGHTGKIIEDNAVGKPMHLHLKRWRSLNKK
jgi:thiol-disulfide isomerase/thioredoxin